LTEDIILKKVDLDWLLSIYGSLLTEKQLTITSLYCEEDLSIAEIAEQEGISRQCVHETLQRVEKQLRSLEEHLQMRNRFDHLQTVLTKAKASVNGNNVTEAEILIDKAIRLLNDEEESNGL